MPDPPPSEDPEPLIVRMPLVHVSEPPVTVAAVGAVRSIRTVAPAAGGSGVHAEVLPALSTFLNSISVCPSAVTSRLPAVEGADHVLPPLVDVRTWGVARAEPPPSLPPAAPTVTAATFCHESEPPLTTGAVGATRSIDTVLPTVGDAGAHADFRPDASVARNCTSVVPAAVIVVDVPVAADDHVAPPS